MTVLLLAPLIAFGLAVLGGLAWTAAVILVWPFFDSQSVREEFEEQ